MSGWTYVTIEAEQGHVEQFPDDETIDDIVDNLRKAQETDDIEECEDLMNDAFLDLEDVEATCGKIRKGHKVSKRIRDITNDDSRSAKSSHVDGTMMYGPRGVARDKKEAQKLAEDLFDEFEYARRILIISANDTGNDGAGILFEKDDNGDISFVDEKVGYESARGQDVVGYFRDEHNIRGKAWR